MNNETITISKQEYDDLIKDSIFLQALISTGVDNWEGYNVAIDILSDKLNEYE